MRTASNQILAGIWWFDQAINLHFTLKDPRLASTPDPGHRYVPGAELNLQGIQKKSGIVGVPALSWLQITEVEPVNNL